MAAADHAATSLVAVIAGWLVAILVVDLLVTRLLLRLAIFIPKEAAVADIVGFVARAGAMIETLAALVAIAAVLAMLAPGAAPASRTSWRIGVALTAGIGAAGLIGVVTPLTVTTAVIVDGLVVGAALALLIANLRTHASRPLLVSLVALAASIVLAAAARIATNLAVGGVDGLGTLPGPLTTAAQLAFVAGALAAGLTGLAGGLRRRRTVATGIETGPSRRSRRPDGPLLAGLAVGLGWASLTFFAPATSQQLLIWSLGLQPVLPPVVLALLAGTAVAGLGRLAAGSGSGRLPALGIGLVLAAGHGLPASYLLLSGLIGLGVAALGPSGEER